MFVPPTELFWEFEQATGDRGGPRTGRASWEMERFCALGTGRRPGRRGPAHRWPRSARLARRRTARTDQRVPVPARPRTPTGAPRPPITRGLRPPMAGGGTPRWPQLAEVIQAAHVGERALRTGELDLDLGADRELLTAVADGQLAWSETQAWVESLRDRRPRPCCGRRYPPCRTRRRPLSWLRSPSAGPQPQLSLWRCRVRRIRIGGLVSCARRPSSACFASSRASGPLRCLAMAATNTRR